MKGRRKPGIVQQQLITPSERKMKEGDDDNIGVTSPNNLYKSLKPQTYKTSRSPGKLTLNMSKNGNLKLRNNNNLTPATISLI